MKEAITFNDVLIVPKFSAVKSRKDVVLSQRIFGQDLMLPVISSNMDTITETKMARAMIGYGAQAALHRFTDIETNVNMFHESKVFGFHERPIVSIGLGENEIERACKLFNAGAKIFLIDVAHGASQAVVEQTKYLKEIIGNDGYIIVGNFATDNSLRWFLKQTGDIVDGVKVGIGNGSVCSTRLKTGVGYPQLSAIMEISKALVNTDVKIIADGGVKNVGDISKALGAGAHAVMIGSMFAGCRETPGDVVSRYVDKKREFISETLVREAGIVFTDKYKKYRGSASKESYDVQGKNAEWRTPEGESVMIPYKGPVKNILQDIEGGLRSAFSYVGAWTLQEFHRNVEFVRVSSNTVVENGVHVNK